MGNSTTNQCKDTEQKGAEQVTSMAVVPAASWFPLSALGALLSQPGKQNGAGSAVGGIYIRCFRKIWDMQTDCTVHV